MQKTAFWTVVLITAPATLIAIKLTRLTLNIKMHSIDNDISPAVSEYIIEEILPEKRLPSNIFTVRVVNPLAQPRVAVASRINTFETPIRAPGIKSGGKRLSITKAMVARAENNPVKQIL